MVGLLGSAAPTGQPFRWADARRVEAVVAAQGEEHWHQVLETEFGGMNEVRGRGEDAAVRQAKGSGCAAQVLMLSLQATATQCITDVHTQCI